MAASSLSSPLSHPLRRFSLHLSHLSKKKPVSSLFLCSAAKMNGHIYRVPALDEEEMNSVAGKTFERYALPSSSSAAKRNGKGVAILWFRNDLRVLDNDALYRAWSSSDTLLPVYCLDPRLFHTTHYFAFPKTGALRGAFLMECLADLRNNLIKRGLNLLIRSGKPEDILPSLAKDFGAHTVLAHKETCSEELHVERLVRQALKGVGNGTKLELIWGSTMYHKDDLPFDVLDLPDMYTQFRKSVEAKCMIRSSTRVPISLGPTPSVDNWGDVPTLGQLGIEPQEVTRGMRFVGGESAGDLLKVYKETRNGMLGPDYSTKFSPWLAFGCISPRFIYEEVQRYERERVANNSTYWVLFELIWRDYFRFLSIKCGNSLFHLGGPRNVQGEWSQDKKLFESWRDGKTGYPIIDANMKELSTTGFMSNRGRQIVCSFLVRDMGLDWRMGAEWFETCLLDYDPCSNYGNWTYGAGVGNDPREDRYFSIPKQAQNYDPEGEYVAFWVQQLRRLPKEKRHWPGRLMYMDTVVPLKHGHGGGSAQTSRGSKSSGGGGFRGNHSGRRSRHNVIMESETKPTFSKSTGLPRKRFYRARAHSNPLSDSHFPIPISPSHVDFSLHFPKFVGTNNEEVSKKVEFADIGCGFGGLLISLATLFPDTLMIGMELRDKVTEYVKERILALRKTSSGGQYENVSVVRTNSMKYIPNYFEKGQLSKMFFLFPDPHFKEKNHRRRVISVDLLDEYAYVLRAGGVIYTITDVEELGEWMRSCLEKHPMFESLTHEELDSDPVVELLCSATEEGQKVARNGGQTFRAVFRRIAYVS
uniref:tRNA (guanine-N(7)-)-methyltransferase n=1 Tax=Brassica oleracea var. oleracea TaxID=109376 RepID=A0A0D3DCZ7_BRAOL